MANTYNYGGDPTVTASHFDTPGTYVYTTYTMPTGNKDINGDRLIRIYTFGTDYASGDYTTRLSYKSVVFTSSSSGRTFDQTSSVGTFAHRLYNDSGVVYFGRNAGSSSSVILSDGSYTWAGALSGHLVWTTVSTAPRTPVATPVTSGGLPGVLLEWNTASDTGASAATNYLIQYSTSSSFPTGPSTGQVLVPVSPRSYFLGPLETGLYYFRVSALNGVGYSAYSTLASAPVDAGGGGGIYTEGAWQKADAFIYDVSAWVPAKGWIYNGTDWVSVQ